MSDTTQAYFEAYLEPGEKLLVLRRLHLFLMTMPVVFLMVGLLQFSPLLSAYHTEVAGWACCAYGLFTGAVFSQLYLHGRVALTSHRLLYLQKFPFKPASLETWARSDFDRMGVRKGVFGGIFGFGHLILTKSGRMVTVIRSVSDPKAMVDSFENN